ncbi:MAG: HEAT repeat domain-containing protein [Rickettsiaceae bacterium]
MSDKQQQTQFRSTNPIAQEIIDQLNKGEREASNLMQVLAIDFRLLLKNTLPEFNCPELPRSLGITKKQKVISAHLDQQFGFNIFDKLKSHKSDSLRSLACYLVGEQPLSFKEKLSLIEPLANDSNSGVREWAWMAIRTDFAQNLVQNIKLLGVLTSNPLANIRRFASELSRPRGVWCEHITELKQSPWLGLSILEPLNSDDANYVQLSVGNWLNDAGKSHPEWVKDLCQGWARLSPTKNTEKICKRALRRLV